jgi:hypothetical protein
MLARMSKPFGAAAEQIAAMSHRPAAGIGERLRPNDDLIPFMIWRAPPSDRSADFKLRAELIKPT